MNSRAVTATVVNNDPCNYEEENVHAVYDEIASHFSSTRYKVSSNNTTPLMATTTKYPGLAMAHHRSVYF